jgi:hypothetical protein
MSTEEYFDSHKTVSDFKDGETVYLQVDGIGEVKTHLRSESYFGPGYLFDDDGDCYGTLAAWLEETHPMHRIIAPPLD